MDCHLRGGPFDGRTVSSKDVIICGRENLVTIGDVTATYTMDPQSPNDGPWTLIFDRVVSTWATEHAALVCLEQGYHGMSLREVAASVGMLIFAAAHAVDRATTEKYLARALVHAETVHLRTLALPVGGPLHNGAPDRCEEPHRLARVNWAVNRAYNG